MQHLLWRQITSTLCALCFFVVAAQAQREENLPDHENKQFYFGITLSGNSSGFQLRHHPSFLQKDSIMYVQPKSNGGFGLGLLASFRVFPHLELRFNPHLIFSNRTLSYSVKYPAPGEETIQEKTIESIYTSFPVQLKFSSDRIGNFRVYIIGGAKYEYDLASNSQRRQAEDLVKLIKGAVGYEAGLGLHFYFPSFIFSPEVKISNTFKNVHSRDPNLIYSNIIDRLQARMIVFSIHLEG
jgi:hypothetical protein